MEDQELPGNKSECNDRGDDMRYNVFTRYKVFVLSIVSGFMIGLALSA